MNSPTHTPAHAPATTQPPAPTGSKTLWAATSVLVVVVLALGAALIRIQSQPLEPRMAVLPQPATAASDTTDDGVVSISTPATEATPRATGDASAAALTAASAVTGATLATTAVPARPRFIEQNKPPALMNKAQVAIKNVTIQTIEITDKPRPVLPRQPEPAVARPPALGASDTATPDSRQPLPR